jgi:hypothetical protein
MLAWTFPGLLHGVPVWLVDGSLAVIAFRKPSLGGNGLKNRWLAPGEFLCDK